MYRKVQRVVLFDTQPRTSAWKQRDSNLSVSQDYAFPNYSPSNVQLQCHFSRLQAPKSSKAFQDAPTSSSKWLELGQGRTLLKKSAGLGMPREGHCPLMLISKHHRWNGAWDEGAQRLPVTVVMITVHDGQHTLPKESESSFHAPPQLKSWGQTHRPEDSDLTYLLVFELVQITVSPFPCWSRTTVPPGTSLLRSAWLQMLLLIPSTARGITVKAFLEIRNTGTLPCHRNKVSYKFGQCRLSIRMHCFTLFGFTLALNIPTYIEPRMTI